MRRYGLLPLGIAVAIVVATVASAVSPVVCAARRTARLRFCFVLSTY